MFTNFRFAFSYQWEVIELKSPKRLMWDISAYLYKVTESKMNWDIRFKFGDFLFFWRKLLKWPDFCSFTSLPYTFSWSLYIYLITELHVRKWLTGDLAKTWPDPIKWIIYQWTSLIYALELGIHFCPKLSPHLDTYTFQFCIRLKSSYKILKLVIKF